MLCGHCLPTLSALNSVLQKGFLKPSEPEAVGWGPISTTLTQSGLHSLRADSILHNLGVYPNRRSDHSSVR